MVHNGAGVFADAAELAAGGRKVALPGAAFGASVTVAIYRGGILRTNLGHIYT